MRDYYGILNTIILQEINKKQTIAIYPFGKIGLWAKEILVNRYGLQGIIIDNNLVRYNSEIIDIDKFTELDSETVTIILCASDMKLNRTLITDLKKRGITAKIRNVLEVPSFYCPEKRTYFEQIKELCKIKKAISYELTRIGREQDGGYVMLDDFQDCSVAYSFGIGEDVSWDEGMTDRGISVYCYDHTIEHLPKRNNRLHFNKIGISDTDRQEEYLMTIDSILRKDGYQNEKNIILKMDVEGAEWQFINTVSLETLEQFSQITLELHELTNIENGMVIIAALKKINKTHQAVWMHANNAGSVETAGNDIAVPGLLEITYVSRKKYKFMPITYNCPLDIDKPNMNDRFDIELINW